MHLGLSLSPQLALRQTQRLNLTQTQRLDLHQHLFGLRLELVGRLHDEHYTPQAKCSGCSYNLKLVEILHGFRDDPDDITTECPKCQRRFTPSLIAHGRFGTKVILSFYCSEQTLARLDGEGRVAFRYANNPNGSLNDIAGIVNEAGNVLGMMPHPERNSETDLGDASGASVFRSIIHAFVEGSAS